MVDDRPSPRLPQFHFGPKAPSYTYRKAARCNRRLHIGVGVSNVQLDFAGLKGRIMQTA